MSDIKYLKNVRFQHKTQIYNRIKANIYSRSDNLDSIEDVLKYPSEFFNELSRYAAIHNIEMVDNIAYFMYNVVVQNGLQKLKIGKNFLKEYDNFYTKFITNSTLKDKTKQVYFNNFERIKTISEKNSLYEILIDPETFYEDLKKFANSKKGRTGENLGDHFIDVVISIAISLFAHNGQFKIRQESLYKRWKTIQETVKKPIDAKYNANKPNKRQNIGISFEDVICVRDSLKDGDDMKLLLMLYTEIPPLRSDYADVRIFQKEDNIPETQKKNEKTENYMVGDIFHLVNYKTAKKYGPKQIKFTKKIMTQLDISLKNKPRNYLFLDSKGKSFGLSENGKNNFNKYFNKKLKQLFKNEKISLTYFRHLYISRPDLKLNEKTLAEREKIALIMGHSLGQQSRYLWM